MYKLTRDEIRRINDTIRRRFPDDPDDNILAVGFGAAYPSETNDTDRSFAACFYVREKKPEEELAAGELIPKFLKIRLKRRKKYVTLTIPTDVIVAPRFTPCSRHVTTNTTEPVVGAAGVLVAWQKSPPGWEWGLVTAGHVVRNDADDKFAFTIQRRHTSTQQLKAEVIAISPEAELLDTALLRVSSANLNLAGVPTPEPPTPGDFWPANKLVSILGGVHGKSDGVAVVPGNTLRGQEDQPGFLTKQYFVNSDGLVKDLGNLKDVILVEATTDVTPPTFAKFTSGSPWTINGRPAAVLVASDEPTRKIGLGQILDTQLEWVRKKLKAGGLGSKFVFVRAF